MYSLEKWIKAVQCLIKNNFCFEMNLHELRYPKTRNSLTSWYKAYQGKSLSAKKPGRSRYTAKQHTDFIEHGRSYHYTVQKLG